MFFVSKKKYKQLEKQLQQTQDATWQATRLHFQTMFETEMLRNALVDIVGQKTKASNATVTRMVNIAQEALDNFYANNERTPADGEETI